jgi:hypothetical protein
MECCRERAMRIGICFLEWMPVVCNSGLEVFFVWILEAEDRGSCSGFFGNFSKVFGHLGKILFRNIFEMGKTFLGFPELFYRADRNFYFTVSKCSACCINP